MGDDKILNLINMFKQYQSRLAAENKIQQREKLAQEYDRYSKYPEINKQSKMDYIENRLANPQPLDNPEDLMGISGGVRNLATTMPVELAEQILKRIPDVKTALNLKPNDRLDYLDSLDTIYGSANQRADDLFGIDLNKLKEAHKKLDLVKKDYDVNTSSNSDYIFDEDGEIIDEIPKGLFAEVIEKSTNKTVGSVPTISKGDFNVVDDITDGADRLVYINPDHRRKKLGSLMYNQIERETGYPMARSTSQTIDGKYFWNSKNAALSDGEISNLVDRKKQLIDKGNLTKEDMDKLSDINWEINTIKKEKDKYKQEYRAFGNERHPDAAFDPRFKDSKNILAGTLALPAANPLNSENIEKDPSFQKLHSLFKGSK